jgi:sigma-B regulation protein RsbU (phosphoserine phosphatase)
MTRGITMKSDITESKAALIKELGVLRQRAQEAESLKGRLDEVEEAYYALKKCYEEQTRAFEKECHKRDRVEEALQVAQVIIDQSPVVLFRRLIGEDARLVYVSPNIGQFEYTAEEFLSGNVTYKDIIYPEDAEWLGPEIREYEAKEVQEYTQVYRIVTKSGRVRWVEDHTSVVRNPEGHKTHTQGIVADITERKLAELELRRSEEKYRRIVETAGEGFILMDENRNIVDVNEAYCRMIGYAKEEILGKTPFDFVADEFRNFIQTHGEDSLIQEYTEFEGSVVSKNGRHIPILIHGNTLRDDRGAVIGNMAFVTDMTEHRKALELAGEVQKGLLPQGQPHVQGLDIAGRSISCEEIGGDYFDYLWGEEFFSDSFGVVVGDISGHGVDAALLMTTARAFLRMRASKPGTISKIITEMNRHFSLDILDAGWFMTLFYMTIEPGNDRIVWIRAGHDPAILYDPALDRFEELKGKGISLGLDDTFVYKENVKTGLSDGTVIAIGTDGIWESCNLMGEMFGKKRFRDIIRENARGSAVDILDGVYRGLDQFTKGLRIRDDITLVAIKIDERFV